MFIPSKEINLSSTRGAVLVLSMIFLLLIAMVAGTVMQTSVLEFRMSGNNQFREEAFQKAHAIAEALAEDPSNFPVSGGIGYTICTAADTDADCNDTNFLTLAAVVEAVPAGVNVNYQVERQGPLLMETLPFRQSEENASSIAAYDVALFETRANIDGGAAGLGRAEVIQGVAVLVASSSQ